MGSSSGANPLLRALDADAGFGSSEPPATPYPPAERSVLESGPVPRESHTAPRRASTFPSFAAYDSAAELGNDHAPELSSIQQASLHVNAALDRLHTGAELRAHELEFVLDLLVAARDLLGGASHEQIELRRRVLNLEQALSRVADDSAHERAFLTDQYDAFVAKLVDDHDKAIRDISAEVAFLRQQSELPSELRETLPPPAVAGSPTPNVASEPPSAPQTDTSPSIEQDLREELNATRALLTRLTEDRERSREALLRLQQQRDDAQATASRVAQERDEAIAELNRARTAYSPTQPSPPPERSRPPIPARSASAPSRNAEQPIEPLEFTLPPLPTLAPLSDQLDAIVASATEHSPPLAIEAAKQASSSDARNPSKPQNALPQKPHPSTRPLIGYSLGGENIAPERLEGAQIPSRPPKRE